MVQMALNRPHADAEMSSDRSVRQPFAHECHDLSLPCREMSSSGHALRLTHKLPTLRHGRIENSVSKTGGPDCTNQLRTRHGLQQISSNSCF